MTNEALVLTLAGELGVGVLVDPTYFDNGGEATGAAGEDFDGVPFIVLTEAPVDERSLLVALHELGHWATRWGPRGGDNWLSSARLELERAAWAWALQHYNPTLLTPEGAQFVVQSLRAYLTHPRYGARTSPVYRARVGVMIGALAYIIDQTEDGA
jgi:hypothetical protein